MADEIKASLDDLMKQAKVMQDNMQEAQKNLTELTVEGKAGINEITITMDGRHFCKSVKLSEDFLDEDQAMMEDLIKAAINDTANKIEKVTKDKMVELTSKLGLPAGLQLPEE